MSKEETNIQREIMLELSKYGIVIRQQCGNFYTEYGSRVQVGFTGISDLQFIRDDGNLIVFIEVKTAKGTPSDEQLNFINFNISEEVLLNNADMFIQILQKKITSIERPEILKTIADSGVSVSHFAPPDEHKIH